MKITLVALTLFALLFFGCTTTQTTSKPDDGFSSAPAEKITRINDVQVNSDADYERIIGRQFEFKGQISTATPKEDDACVYVCEPSPRISDPLYCIAMVTGLKISQTQAEQGYPATQFHTFAGAVKNSPNPYGCKRVVYPGGDVEDFDKSWAADKGYYLELNQIGTGFPLEKQ